MFTRDEIKTPRIFRPFGTIAFDATTTSTAAIALTLETNSTTEHPIVRICNTSTSSAVRYEFGSGTATTAGTASPYLLPNTTELLDRGVNTHLAVIAVTGTCSISATTGEGVYTGS